MTDRERLLAELTTAGLRGLHSLDIRRAGLSGNPSQRIRELRDRGYVIRSKTERRGHRNGTRYFLDAGLSLFEPEPAKPRGYGDLEDAA